MGHGPIQLLNFYFLRIIVLFESFARFWYCRVKREACLSKPRHLLECNTCCHVGLPQAKDTKEYARIIGSGIQNHDRRESLEALGRVPLPYSQPQIGCGECLEAESDLFILVNVVHGKCENGTFDIHNQADLMVRTFWYFVKSAEAPGSARRYAPPACSRAPRTAALQTHPPAAPEAARTAQECPSVLSAAKGL